MQIWGDWCWSWFWVVVVCLCSSWSTAIKNLL